MNRIRKGDQVIVITGKYKGQKGEVHRVAIPALVEVTQCAAVLLPKLGDPFLGTLAGFRAVELVRNGNAQSWHGRCSV